eukprot:6974466-Prymnesium_polylepis.2
MDGAARANEQCVTSASTRCHPTVSPGDDPVRVQWAGRHATPPNTLSTPCQRDQRDHSEI